MMNENQTRKLRQTTLQFATGPKAGNSAKRKMADKDAVDATSQKRKKLADAAEKRKENKRKEETEQKPPQNKAADEDDSEAATTSTAKTQVIDDSAADGNDSPASSEETDNPESEGLIPNKKPSMLKRESSWRGTKLAALRRNPNCLGEVKPLHTDKTHTVLFKLPYQYKGTDRQPPTPFPAEFMDKWDQDHVRMPCSPQNEYPVEGKGGKPVLRRRWELIEEALCGKLTGPYELEDAILSYNQRYAKKWNFKALTYFFTDHMRKDDRLAFFDKTVPKMTQLALNLPMVCTQPIPLLKRGKRHSLTLSQQQVACLLANAFFCTFPRRNKRQRHAEYANYADINFNSLFQGEPSPRKMGKLMCIVHYFKRITEKMPLGVVTFHRQVIENFPNWEDQGTDFTRLYVSAAGTIEDDGVGMLQADFANKYIGGGVLGHGCVQEEIRFLVCPEMIITRLFTEVLDKNESLLMQGCERFSKYDGYASTFTWDGEYDDKTERDINGRLHTDVIAIDALIIHDYKRQFQKWCVVRELNKAYVGFHHGILPPDQLSAVATGNWGCGAFGGDKRLKALIQLMAAAQAKRDVCYFTFDDDVLCDELYKIHQFISKENGLGVGNVMQLIGQYERNVIQKCWGKPVKNLFQYIVAAFEGTLDSDSGDDMRDDFSDGSREGQDMESDTGCQKPGLQRGVSQEYKAYTP